MIGVQPEVLDDFGGSLRPSVRARLDEAVDLAAAELAGWGLPGRVRAPGEAVEPLNDRSLAIEHYETGPPLRGRRVPHRRRAPACRRATREER